MENLRKNIWKILEKIFEIEKIYDICQSAAPSKQHISYGKSFKKFNGGGVVVVLVACLIIVSFQILSFENLTLNFELLSSDLNLDHGLDTGHWTLDLDQDLDLDLGPDLELDNKLCGNFPHLLF